MRIREYLALVLVLGLLAVMAGCASSGGNRGKGSLSQATADAAVKEESKERGEGRTRTKEDVHDPESSYYAHQEETSENSGGGFLFGLITSLFTSDDDDLGPEPYDPEAYDPYDYPDEGSTGEFQTWEDRDEFGMDPPAENKDADESTGGGGIDIKRGNLNFWYSLSTLGGDAIQGFTTYTLMYSGYTGRQYRAHAGLYYGRGKKGGQQNIQDGIRWISEAGLDVGTRGYFTPDHSLMGFYMILGLRAGITYWSYFNAIEAPNDDGTTESISKDGLWVFVPYVGLGSSILQTEKVHLGLNFTVGGRLYTDRTIEDFANDLLKNVWEYKLNFEASFFF